MRKSLFVGYNLFGFSIVVLFSYFNSIRNINAILIFLPMTILSLFILFIYKKISKETTISDIVISIISLEVFGASIYLYTKTFIDFSVSQANVSNVFLYGITNISLLLVLFKNKFPNNKELSKAIDILASVIVVFGTIISAANCFVKIIY